MIIYEPITTLSKNIPIGTPIYNKLGCYCGDVVRHHISNMYATDKNKHFYDNWLGTYGFPKSYKISDIVELGTEVGFRIKPMMCQFSPINASIIIT